MSTWREYGTRQYPNDFLAIHLGRQPAPKTERIVNGKQRREWQELCLRAVKEPDPAKQLEIVAEMNRMLQQFSKATGPEVVLPQRRARRASAG